MTGRTFFEKAETLMRGIGATNIQIEDGDHGSMVGVACRFKGRRYEFRIEAGRELERARNSVLDGVRTWCTATAR